jgi:hypothetical protein
VNLFRGVIQIMFFTKLRIAAAVFVGLGASGLGLAFGQSPRVARPPAPAAPSAKVSLAPTRLSSDGALLYRYVKRHRPGEFDWEQVPWLTDLAEAIRQAKAENRPLLLWTVSEEPLERC